MMRNSRQILFVLFIALVALVESCSGKTEKVYSVNTVAYYDDMPQCSENSTTYYYKEKYCINLPDKMELQSSELNNVTKKYDKGKKTYITNPIDRIVFQQNGLNDDSAEAYKKYCRVIIEYSEEDRDEPVWGCGEQLVITNELINLIFSYIKDECANMKTPFMKILTAPQPINIHDFPVLYYSYKRQGWEGKHPPVIVNVYHVYNRYESVKLTFSYREAEREQCKDIHNYIIETFFFKRKY